VHPPLRHPRRRDHPKHQPDRRRRWDEFGLVDYLPKDLAQLFAHAYAGGAPLTHAGLSPLYADLRGLPPLLVEVGECEVRCHGCLFRGDG
jgi:hypothetical protein